jgi:hypothetical protein
VKAGDYGLYTFLRLEASLGVGSPLKGRPSTEFTPYY